MPTSRSTEPGAQAEAPDAALVAKVSAAMGRYPLDEKRAEEIAAEYRTLVNAIHPLSRRLAFYDEPLSFIVTLANTKV